MPSELILRVNCDLLYPRFLEKLLDLLADQKAQGRSYFLTLGTRTWAEQGRLYFQGRTTPGTIVTHARPGESPHQYGIGVDTCLDGDNTKAGLQPNWAALAYKPLHDAAPKFGLETGYGWKTPDPDHVQLPLDKHGITWPQLQQIYKTGGQPAVWAFLDTLAW